MYLSDIFLLLPHLLLSSFDDADKGLSPAAAADPSSDPSSPWSYAILMKHLKSINENKKSPTHTLSHAPLPTPPLSTYAHLQNDN